MTEPTSSTAAWLAWTATAGAVLGIQYDALLPGLIGGLIALSFAQPTTRLRMMVSVATSTVLAAYGAPVLAAVAVGYMASIGNAGDSAVRALSAVAIGTLAQQIVAAAQHLVASISAGTATLVLDQLKRLMGRAP